MYICKFWFSHLCYFIFLVSFKLYQLSRCVLWFLSVVLIYIYLVSNDVEQFFLFLFFNVFIGHPRWWSMFSILS